MALINKATEAGEKAKAEAEAEEKAKAEAEAEEKAKAEAEAEEKAKAEVEAEAKAEEEEKAKAEVEEKAKAKAEAEANPVKVQAKTHKQRHPVTGVMFYPGQAIDILNLNDPDHAFVRHQIDAGVFEIV